MKRYNLTQPELLRSGARLSAPVYESRNEDKKIEAEAVFCYLVAGNQHEAILLLNKLLEQASGHNR